MLSRLAMINLYPILWPHLRLCLLKSIRPINLKGSRLITTEFKDVPGVKVEGEKFAMLYTCKKCETRSAKYISKQAYNNGVVVVRCPTCKSLHLISDHLGVFEDPGWDIEKFMSDNNESVKRITDENVYEITENDIVGNKDNHS